MLRSTFAAYNAAHPDKPLINPRGGAAGTVRAKDPKTVAERRLSFFAFDLDGAELLHSDLEAALKTLGFAAAQMAHCDDAEAAQKVIGEIEATRDQLDYDLDGAVIRLADRNAYAAAGTRSNSPRGALAFKFAAEEKTTLLNDVLWDVGKTGKIAPVAALEPVFVGGTTVMRATLANQEVIRARGIKIGDTVLVRRAGDVIPFVAGVLDASKRTGAETGHRPADPLPVVRRAADRAGQQPRAVLHERRLPGADRPPPHPLGKPRRRGHRGGRPGVDRAPCRGEAAREPLRHLRAHPRAAARVRPHRRGVRRPHDRVDRGVQERRPAARADRARDPDGLRGHRRAPVPLGLQVARGRRRRGCGEAPAGRGHRPEGRGFAGRVPQPRAPGAREAARPRRLTRRARGGPAARGRRRRAAGREDRRHHRHDLRPPQRREDPPPDLPAPVREGRARPPPRASPRAPTC